jgi:hypothetical protein
VRTTCEAIVGTITSPLDVLSSLLLGRFDTDGRLRYGDRTTTPSHTVGSQLAGLLDPSTGEHPWMEGGRSPPGGALTRASTSPLSSPSWWLKQPSM